MLGEGIGQQLCGREEAHLVTLATGCEFPSHDAAEEAEDDRILMWRPAVDPSQSLGSYLEASLLACLAVCSISWRLARRHPSTALAPPITVGAVHQEHTSCSIQDGGEQRLYDWVRQLRVCAGTTPARVRQQSPATPKKPAGRVNSVPTAGSAPRSPNSYTRTYGFPWGAPSRL